MHVAARARLALARRPWIYWTFVATLAALVAVSVDSRLAAIDAARDDWGDLRSVFVADGQLEPGDVVVARLVELPVVALPESALTDVVEGVRMRQRAADGEVLTSLDVIDRPGPAAAANIGEVVVPIADPLARGVLVGMAVQIVADGLLLADSARVTDVADDVVFVAVPDSVGPTVAAASQQGIASLLYLP